MARVRTAPVRYDTVYREGFWRIIDKQTGLLFPRKYLLESIAAREINRLMFKLKD